LLQAVLSVGLGTHAQVKAQLEESAPLRALGLIELAPAAIGKPLGLRVPSWLIDFMLGLSATVVVRESSAPPASEAARDHELAERFFRDASNLKREHHRLTGFAADQLTLLDRVCARAQLKQLVLDLRRVSTEKMREQTRRAAHLAALREHALVAIFPTMSRAPVRSLESFVHSELEQDLAQMAKHLRLCATIEEEV
jgi:hypothetical protein